MAEANHLRDWFNTPVAPDLKRYQVLSLNALCKQIGYDQANFRKYLLGSYGLREPHLSNMVTLCEGLGYKPVSNEHHFL